MRVSEQWYRVDEVPRIDGADGLGFTPQQFQWIAQQLNAAFRKGAQVGGGQAVALLERWLLPTGHPEQFGRCADTKRFLDKFKREAQHNG